MNPLDFFETAELLKNNPNEAHIRTSISRSFYATFLYLLSDITTNFLLNKTVKDRAQAFVALCLQNCEAREAKKIGSAFDTLRQKRRDADYHLEMTLTSQVSRDVLDFAEKMVEDYKTIIGIPKIKRKIAKSVKIQARFKGIVV